MGTSSSYTGPTGRNPLLPPWAEEVPLDPAGQMAPENTPATTQEEIKPVPVTPWSTPKAAMRRLGSGASATTIRSVVRSYVRASGGAGTATGSARAGRATTARIGGFLANGVRIGFVQAAEQLGLRNLLGRDAQFVLAAFVDLLAPPGALREEAAARKAAIETLVALFEWCGVEENGLDALDHIDVAGITEILTFSISFYINARLQQELVSRIERSAMGEHEANALLADVKDFVVEIVRVDFTRIDVLAFDWEGQAGRSFVEGIYEDAYVLLVHRHGNPDEFQFALPSF